MPSHLDEHLDGQRRISTTGNIWKVAVPNQLVEMFNQLVACLKQYGPTGLLMTSRGWNSPAWESPLTVLEVVHIWYIGRGTVSGRM